MADAMMMGDANDMQPLMDDKKDMDNEEEQKDPDLEFDPDRCDGQYEGCCSGPSEEPRFVWSIYALVEENRKRKSANEIEIVRRIDNYDYRYGLRAHPRMDVAKSCWSILVPWHNEWLAIIIYLAFGLYFLIETFLILGRSS